MAPVVVDQVTVTVAGSLFLVSPVPTNCALAPGASDTTAGVTTSFAPAAPRITTLESLDFPSDVALSVVTPTFSALNVIAGFWVPTSLASAVLVTVHCTVLVSSSPPALSGCAVMRN